jgi:biotin carboxyl carrier protein
MKTYKFKVNNKDYEVAVGDADGKNVKVTVNGTDYDVELPEAPKTKPVIAKPAAAPAIAPAATKSAPAPAAAGAAGSLKSPLPGTILSVNVTVGQAVKASDCVLVLEAMKMENNINAGKDGTVKAIYVNKGDNVLEAADLMLIE